MLWRRRDALALIALSMVLPAAQAFAAAPLPFLRSRSGVLAGACAAPASLLRGGCGVTGPTMSMYSKIEEKLTAGLEPIKLTIVDNSHQHAGHAGVNGRE